MKSHSTVYSKGLYLHMYKHLNDLVSDISRRGWATFLMFKNRTRPLCLYFDHEKCQNRAQCAEYKSSGTQGPVPDKRLPRRCLPLDLSSSPGGSCSLFALQQGQLVGSMTGFSRQSSESHKSTRSVATAPARNSQEIWFTAEDMREHGDHAVNLFGQARQFYHLFCSVAQVEAYAPQIFRKYILAGSRQCVVRASKWAPQTSKELSLLRMTSSMHYTVSCIPCH